MSTPNQTIANRANAQKSTGPRTTAGKQKVKINALRHGLTGRTVVLPADDLDLYRTHVKTLTASLKPEGPEEIQLAALIADDYWRLQRIHSIEDGIFAMQFAENETLATHPAADATLNQAQAYLDHSKELERLTLYEQRIHRNIKAATARLEALKQSRRAAETTATPHPRYGIVPGHGFEFSTSHCEHTDTAKMPSPSPQPSPTTAQHPPEPLRKAA